MRKAYRGEQTLRQHIRLLGFQKCASCATFLHLAESDAQERSSHSLVPKFWTRANDTDFPNEMLILTTHHLLEFTLTKSRKSSGRLDLDQGNIGLIHTGQLTVHAHAHPIKHTLMHLL